MSVYSELINDSGFDPGEPGPSARFVGWGCYNPVGKAWIEIVAGTDAETARIPIVIDLLPLIPEVSVAPEEAA